MQVRAWRTAYDGLLPADVLASLDPAEIAAAWHASLSTPKDARNRVLVALERNTIRGFALTSASDPDTDPINDGEVSDLTVDPAQTRTGPRLPADAGLRGHPGGPDSPAGLLWVAATDDALRRFATGRAGPRRGRTAARPARRRRGHREAGPPAHRPVGMTHFCD